MANDSATKAYPLNLGEALTALLENRVSTLPRADMTGAFEDMKGAVVEMIKARLAASQPAH